MNQCITGSRGGGGGTGHFTGSTTGSHFDLRNKDNLLLYQKASPDFFSAKKWLHTFNKHTLLKVQMLQIQLPWVTSFKSV